MFTSLARAERDLVVLEVNAAFLTLFAMVTQTPLSKLFGFVPLDWKQFFMVIAIAMGAVFWMELPKAWKRWRMKG
ncbi:MAG: cation transporting ATPase C-terminal domain-containing protein [Sphaerochaetaceae bacterium]